MKIKMFTHNDLDGVGCAVLGKLAYGDKLDYMFCTYNNVNELIGRFIASKEVKFYTHIFITDLMVSEETAVKLNAEAGKMMLLDHHVSNMALATKLGYGWFNVVVGETVCGTNLFYDRVKTLLPATPDLLKFIELTSLYDTWRWAETWNTDAVALSKFVGTGQENLKDKVNCLIDFIGSNSLDALITKFDSAFYFKKLEGVIQKTCYKVDNFMVGIDLEDVGLMAEILRKQKVAVDALIDIRPSQMKGSVRSVAESFDSAAYAKSLGGGGHTKAAGFIMDKDYAEQVTAFSLKLLHKRIEDSKIAAEKQTKVYAEIAAQESKDTEKAVETLKRNKKTTSEKENKNSEPEKAAE